MSWLERTDEYFRDLNLWSLWVDRAYFNVSNGREADYFLYSLASNCVRCPFRHLSNVTANSDTVLVVNTARPIEMKLFDKHHGSHVFPNQSNDGLVWEDTPKMGQFGVYDLILDPSGTNRFEVALEPVPIYWSILVIAVITVAFYWLCKCINHFILSRWRKSAIGSEETTKKRLKSLDIFRGISMVLMIFVNYGGGYYWWTGHADWNGFLMADIVFPWFLFIMGVCIPMSIRSQFMRKIATIKIVQRILTRSVLLFLIGLCMFAQSVTFSEVRIMNVLQRFAIAYLLVSLVHVAFVQYPEYRAPQLLDDLKLVWKEWILMVCIVAIHTGIVFGIKLDGCDRGYVGPGGTHDFMTNPLCTGGVTGFVDRAILTENHMFQWASIRSIYEATQRFDPEGIFGSLTTVFHAFLGLQCGVILMVYQDHKDRLIRWLIWGTGLTFLTLILTLCSIEDAPIPINKNLWSLTYVTATSASSFFLLALIYFIVDMKEIGDDFWTIFQYPGMNAILIYIGHLILDKHWPFHFYVERMNTHFIYLLKNIYTCIIWIFVAHILYRKKIFFSL
ncbi:unnamed protein product [Chironomus riparius]|uniref:Heparan-alpha-glucosaminide N-acetyltransferase n=1 Tax=Chironomus riparius TaxID=315576 RepID=A0A9N9RRJ9_9DIPT|nr:unnamed protein product [Chironomus riparius]